MESITEFIVNSANSDIGIIILILLSISESFFFPLPPDILLVPLALLDPNKAIFFSIITLCSSILGGIIGHQLGAKFGRKILESLHLSPNKKIEKAFNRYGFWSVVVAGITPIPYKIFSISAGIVHFSLSKFVIASIIGRGIRFLTIGISIFLFGDEFNQIINLLFDSKLAISVSVIIVCIMIIIGLNEYLKE